MRGRDGADRSFEGAGADRPHRAANPRYVPAALRDDTLKRAGYRCAFVGIDGTRCSETRGLQIDHITPVALGGRSDPGNLRVLCRAHNLHEAERLLGKERMARYARSACSGGGEHSARSTPLER
jgi:5-methylcytosine-specific restriction endonuclease McrA